MRPRSFGIVPLRSSKGRPAAARRGSPRCAARGRRESSRTRPWGRRRPAVGLAERIAHVLHALTRSVPVRKRPASSRNAARSARASAAGLGPSPKGLDVSPRIRVVGICRSRGRPDRRPAHASSSASSFSSGLVNEACAGPRRPRTTISRTLLSRKRIERMVGDVGHGKLGRSIASIRATSRATLPLPTTTARSCERSNSRSA